MAGGIFLSIKDLMLLTGNGIYNNAQREHLAIRDSLGKKDKKLTIREYCEFEGIAFDYVWEFLRGKQSKNQGSKNNQ